MLKTTIKYKRQNRIFQKNLHIFLNNTQILWNDAHMRIPLQNCRYLQVFNKHFKYEKISYNGFCGIFHI